MRTRDELLTLLCEQYTALNISKQAFDGRFVSEAKRLATTIRVLVHDTAKSRSLMSQLDLKDRLRWVSSVDADAVRQYADPGSGVRGFHGLISFGDVGYHATVPIRNEDMELVSFNQWWLDPAMVIADGTAYTRSELVLWLANQDGGAHVDPKLNAKYKALSREGGFGLRYVETDELVVTSPVPAAVRTVAEEVARTLHGGLPLIRDWHRYMYS